MTYNLIKKGQPNKKKLLFALLTLFATILAIVVIGGYLYLAVTLEKLSFIQALLDKRSLFLVGVCAIMVGFFAEKYSKHKRLAVDKHETFQIENQRLIYQNQSIPAKSIEKILYSNFQEFSSIFIVQKKQTITIDYSPKLSDDFFDELGEWSKEHTISFERKII